MCRIEGLLDRNSNILYHVHVPLPQRISQRDGWELTEDSPGCGERLKLRDRVEGVCRIKD
jgi:hypothetical protein